MQAEVRSGRLEAVRAHPLAELLQCPSKTRDLLNESAQCVPYTADQIVFQQNESCKGLYVVVSGLFQRRAERLDARLSLGPARVGELVELAAALGAGRHTYALRAQSEGSLLLLPQDALNQAFNAYPPLRMQLLEELAREVSRAYYFSCQGRTVRNHHAEPAAARST